MKSLEEEAEFGLLAEGQGGLFWGVAGTVWGESLAGQKSGWARPLEGSSVYALSHLGTQKGNPG